MYFHINFVTFVSHNIKVFFPLQSEFTVLWSKPLGNQRRLRATHPQRTTLVLTSCCHISGTFASSCNSVVVWTLYYLRFTPMLELLCSSGVHKILVWSSLALKNLKVLQTPLKSVLYRSLLDVELKPCRRGGGEPLSSARRVLLSSSSLTKQQ